MSENFKQPYIRPYHCPTPPDGMAALEALHHPHTRRRGRGTRSDAYRALKRDWDRKVPLKVFARTHPAGPDWFANKKRSER